MEQFKTKIDGYDKNYTFDCYPNTETINIGDKFLFFFGGIADVQECCSENEKEEINKNDRKRDNSCIDLVTGFWRKCYKIKNTNFDLNKLNW